MKLIVPILYGLLAAGGTGWVLFEIARPGATAPGVTANHIRQVQLGMTPAQVAAILGRPYRFSSTKGSNTHYMATCADYAATQQEVTLTDTMDITRLFRRAAADTTVHVCDAHDERKHDRRSTLTYTRPGGIARTYPMLWVHFDRQARVNNVFAKEYATDDYCIYSLAADSVGNVLNQEALVRLFDAGR